jgi:hypothetical protein
MLIASWDLSVKLRLSDLCGSKGQRLSEIIPDQGAHNRDVRFASMDGNRQFDTSLPKGAKSRHPSRDGTFEDRVVTSSIDPCRSWV